MNASGAGAAPAPADDRPPTQRIVLLGLPGAGKSTVGAVLARRLGWEFLDVDAEIVARTGRPIAEVFRTDGETAFRAMEFQLTAELSSLSHVVLAPGGGWAAQTGALESLPAGTATVWLRISPDEAIRRLRGTPTDRPLLAGPDPLAAMRRLSGERTVHYARADHVVDVDQRPASDIADSISEWLRPRIS